jgi:glutamyl-tRNA reductase
MDLHQVGVDPHVAPIEVRERLAVAPGDAPALAARVKDLLGAEEALLVATCNRTELFVVHAADGAAEQAWQALLAALPGAPSTSSVLPTRRSGDAAVRHLYRLAAGLESAILGETEIQGQLRDAHAACTERGVAGPLLDRLVRGAIHAGKRARTETPLSAGGVSHGSAAAQVARRVFGALDDREILVVGAGHIALQAARALTEGAEARLTFANRTAAHAASAAAQAPGAATAALEQVPQLLASAHVVVLAAGGLALEVEAVRAALPRRRDPLLVLDLCVPRAAPADVGRLPGVFVYDLDSLEAQVATALAGRREAVPRVEAILDEELARVRDWARTVTALPVIRSLHEWAEELRTQALAELPPGLDPATSEAVDALTRRLVKRLLGRPTARVAEGARAADPRLPTADHLKHLFGLDDRSAS